MEAKGNLGFYFDRLEHTFDGDYDDSEEFKVKCINQTQILLLTI